MEYVSPEYQEQLDGLAESLRSQRAEAEYEEAIDAFEEVFLPRAFFQQRFEGIE